jgi:hypothetical protein
MKKFLTYNNFLRENYLPYFGVKQALDDSKRYVENTSEGNSSDFHRIYSMTPTWWNLWTQENEGAYEIKQDAFSKTYEISKDGKLIFIFDYNRNKIFTNEKPDFFVTKDPNHNEYEQAKEKEVETLKSKEDSKDEKFT